MVEAKVSFINPTFYLELSLMILFREMIMMKMWVMMTLICNHNLTIPTFAMCNEIIFLLYIFLHSHLDNKIMILLYNVFATSFTQQKNNFVIHYKIKYNKIIFSCHNIFGTFTHTTKIMFPLYKVGKDIFRQKILVRKIAKLTEPISTP